MATRFCTARTCIYYDLVTWIVPISALVYDIDIVLIVRERNWKYEGNL